MSCGGSGGGTNTVTQNSAPPQWLQNNLQSLYGQAQNITSQPLSQYGGQTVAGFTPTQNQAIGAVNNAQGTAQPYYNQAQQLITNASQPITPSAINAQTIAQYQSPYQQQVINTTQQQLNQNDATQQQQLLGQAIQSGASPFGGDRAGIAAAALAGQQDLANNQTIAGLENQGYTQALGEANTQQQAQLGAQEASQYLGQQGGFGLTNLGTTAENTALQGASAQLQAGGLQQQLGQELLNVPYEQYVQQQAYPYQQLSTLEGAAGLAGGLSGGTSSTTSPAPSTLSQIGGLGLSGLALAGGAKRGGVMKMASGGSSTSTGLLSQYPTLQSYLASPLGQGDPNGIHWEEASAQAQGVNINTPYPIANLSSYGSFTYPSASSGASSAPTVPSGIPLAPTYQQFSQGLGAAANNNSATAYTGGAAPAGMNAADATSLQALYAPIAKSARGGLIPHYDLGGNIALPQVPDLSLSYITGESGSQPLISKSDIPAAPKGSTSTTTGNGSPAPNLGSLALAGKGASNLFSADGLLGSNGSLFGATGLFGSQGALSGVDSALSPGLMADMGAADSAVTGADAFASVMGSLDASSIADALPLVASFLKKGGIAKYDDGGTLPPPNPSANPLQANNINQKLQQMTPDQLQQMAMKMPPNSPYATVIQKALQQKRMMPNVGQGIAAGAPQPPQAPTVGMSKGGLPHFDDGGMADEQMSPAVAAADMDATPMTQLVSEAQGQLDKPSVIDHSGPTMQVKHSNGETIDLGLPSDPAQTVTNVSPPSPADKSGINMPLLAAGLGMMAGRSPHALENIGTGGLQGLKEYASEREQADKEAQQKAQQAYQTGELGLRGKEIAQTGQYQQGELSARQQELANQKAYQTGELANQAAERQKPIPDGFGGFIIPNPKDPTHPTQVNMGNGAGVSGVATTDANGNALTGDAYLATLDPRIARTAKMVADGDMAFPTGFALKSPYWQTVLGAVQQYDPTANANRFPAVKAFNTGSQGNQTRFLNVATAHLDTLDKLTDALDNNDTKALNTIGNIWKTQTGQTAPTNFDTAKQIVADEVTKAVIGAGGTGADREKAAQVINNANSPAQLHEAVATYKTLMAGQLNGLQQQYEVSTGRKDFQDRYLTPQAKAALNPQGNSGSAASSIPLAPTDPKQRVVGQTYTNPNGVQGKWTGTGWQPIAGVQ